MLKCGSYPYDLKKRILSNRGHLSNADCALLAVRLAQAGTKNILLAHLSEENNDPAVAYDEVYSALGDPNLNLAVADQYTATFFVDEKEPLC
jgi:phosphoribosyl 1,2-cyclic phosphodiesterase